VLAVYGSRADSVINVRPPANYTVQVPKIEDQCGGKCPFVPSSASFDKDPTPGLNVTITFKGHFGKVFTSGHYECKTAIRILFWIDVSSSTGDACEPVGKFKCPVQIGNGAEAAMMGVPTSAVSGSYRAHCKYFDQNAALYADAYVFFSIL